MPRPPLLVCLLGLTMVTLTWGAALAQAVADSTAGPHAATDSPPRAKVKKRRPTPPRLLTRDAPLLRFDGARPGNTNRQALFLEVRVMIDPEGTPDLSTLKVAGLGAVDNRDEVAQWLLRARFEPALDEDRTPTRGEFVFRVRAGS